MKPVALSRGRGIFLVNHVCLMVCTLFCGVYSLSHYNAHSLAKSNSS